MKKRILAILATLALSTSVFGQEMIVENASSQQSTVTYSVPSEYVVLIPETIIADGREYRFQASVMDLRSNEHVDISIDGIYPEGLFKMYAPSGRQMMARLSSSRIPNPESGSILATFNADMLESFDSFSIAPETWEGAGDYSATLTFNINLVTEG